MSRIVRSTSFGDIVGVQNGECLAWYGVRYATASRFEPAEIVEPLAPLTYDATREAPSCPQAPNFESSAAQSEDCLFINVFLPAHGLPPNSTFAYIHGGGLSSGSIGRIYSNHFSYDGCALAAARGVAVVTMQYRVGALGWLVRPHANLGLRDQACALRFARRLLGAVASSRVLLFGQSAGSISLCAHLFAPESRGLFDAAALLSSLGCPTFPRQAAEAITDGFLAASPFARSGAAARDVWPARTTACIRNLSIAQVLQAQARLGSRVITERPGGGWQLKDHEPSADGGTPLYSLQLMWSPIVDGHTLQIDPQEALARGEPLAVPVVLGEVAMGEVNALIFDGGPVEWSKPKSRTQFVRDVTSICSTPNYHICRPDDVPKIVQWYSEGTACSDDACGDCKLPLVEIMGDGLDFCCRRRTARWMSARTPTFVYEWRWRLRCGALDTAVDPEWGAYHESEIPFIFPPFDTCRRTVNGDALSSGGWGSLLYSLITVGEPGCMPSTNGSCVTWPAYNAAPGHTMLLGNLYDASSSLSSVVDDAELRRVFGGGDRSLARACDFWDSLHWRESVPRTRTTNLTFARFAANCVVALAVPGTGLRSSQVKASSSQNVLVEGRSDASIGLNARMLPLLGLAVLMPPAFLHLRSASQRVRGRGCIL